MSSCCRTHSQPSQDPPRLCTGSLRRFPTRAPLCRAPPPELESEVRHLQRDLKSARADDQEVQELVAAHEREKAAGARLRSELEEAQASEMGGAGRLHGPWAWARLNTCCA